MLLKKKPIGRISGVRLRCMRNELGRNFSERYRFGAPNPNMGVGEAPRTPSSVLGTLPAMAILLTVAQYSTAFAEHSVPRPEIAPGELKFHALAKKDPGTTHP
jgi:hypothetical protein